MLKIRIAMGQMLVEGGNIEQNLERAESMIHEASNKNCEIIVLPECLDAGWTDPRAVELAREIPGETSKRICQAAKNNGIMVVAGLTELEEKRIYNSAILVNEDGDIILKHRKINVLDVAQNLYSIGNTLSVAETEMGVIGINICADNFPNSLAIGHVLARMGANFILSPSSWAVDSGHDNTKQPYGRLWKESYRELCRLYSISIIGVSNVGRIAAGPWKGRQLIGCSLAVGTQGEVLAIAPYGSRAECIVTVSVRSEDRNIKGTEYAKYLEKKGYVGP